MNSLIGSENAWLIWALIIVGTATSIVVVAAKKLHFKPRNEKVRLELIIPVQRGNFIRLTQGTADLNVR